MLSQYHNVDIAVFVVGKWQCLSILKPIFLGRAIKH